jgi:hypothetical protein
MTQIGSPSEWNDLIDSQVPDILTLVIETWARLPTPAANELEDSVTNRLCAALQCCPDRATYPFHIRSQTVILEPGSGNELGRMDIAFLPFVSSDEIYFCLECKRLNVRGLGGIRPYSVEYVRFGMLRFVSGQYAGAVRNGGMLAFVLNGDVAGAIAGVEDNIRTLHVLLGMDAPGSFQTSRLRPTDATARETNHRRSSNPDPFVIHHLFVAGDPNAPMLPDPPADSTDGAGKKKQGKARRRIRK